jgi:phosphotransferase system enzyme I (PtsI)
VVGVGEDLLEAIQQNMAIIVDGHTGIVIADPDQAILDVYLRRQDRERPEREEARSAALAPALTKDGQRVTVAANIGNAESVESALAHGAEAIGLVRTEFLFLDRASWPDEEEQYIAYRAIAQAMGSRSVIFRTLDAGGDKPLPFMDIPGELNPFLGLRAIRLSLAQPDRLQTQLCALLRAGVGCNVKIMFPMISAVEEIRSAQLVLEEARAELRIRGAAFADRVEIGIMIEVPSAALCASALAQEVDFFSIGTNDLIQYTLAVDRTNERVDYLYDPLHPAVLYLIKHAIVAAHQAGKWVGMCGEMASDLDALPLLLGMGLDEFSVTAACIPNVKTTIRSLDVRAAQDLTAQALQLSTATEIRALVRQNRPEVNS